MNQAATSIEPPARPAEALVARNALILFVGQVAVMPLSLLLNAVMARHLGPQDFGYFYLAGQFASFGFLVADFGLGGLKRTKSVISSPNFSESTPFASQAAIGEKISRA